MVMPLALVILIYLRAYAPLLAFISGMMFGELFIILGILAGAGVFSVTTIWLFGLLGEISHDLLMYGLANSKLGYLIKKRFKLSTKKSRIAKYIENKMRKNYFLPVFFSKFIYGVREVVLFYVAHHEKKIKRYILNIIAADVLWITGILLISWLAGRGFTALLPIFRDFERIALVIAVGIIFVIFVNKIIISSLMKVIRKKSS